MRSLDCAFVGAMALHHRQHGRPDRAAQFEAMLRPPEDDRRAAHVVGLCEALTVGGMTTSTARPAGRFRLKIESELLKLPDVVMARLREASEVHLFINSPGGDIDTALAVLNAAGPRLTRVHVTGPTASAAALLVALCPGHRAIHPDATMTLHPPATLAFGSAKQLRDHAAALDALHGHVVAQLARRTGREPGDVESWMAGGDRVFTPAEALHVGLVDSISPTV